MTGGTGRAQRVEGNVRAVRDHGLLPIVFERINNFFAPVITSEQLVEWIAH
jgi:hypothetical protein